MTLKSLFQKDLDNIFFSESDFGEPVFYKRKIFNYNPDFELIALSDGVTSAFSYSVLYSTIYQLESLKISYYLGGVKKLATSNSLGVITGDGLLSGSFTLSGLVSLVFTTIPDTGTKIIVEEYKTTKKVLILVLPDYKADLEQIAQGQRHSAQVVIRKSQVRDPEYKDKIEIDGEDWQVERVDLGADGRVNYVSLRRDYRAKI